MVPDVAGKGHSFAGAMRYYLHDTRQPGDTAHPTTSERVAWTAVRNLPVGDDEAQLATRLMIATACQAEALKRRAGIATTGRRSTKAVYAFSLSWHPSEAAGLDRTEMLRAADAALAALGIAHLQCVIVCHRDQAHPHVHCIVNRVDPEDGRMAVLSKDRERLSKWAHAYERARGPLLTPARARKYGPDAEREAYAGRDQHAPQPVREATRQREPSERVMLAQLDTAQKARHAEEWRALERTQQTERKATLTRHPSARTMIAEHRAERRTAAATLAETQARELAALDTRNRGLLGRIRTAINAAREAAPKAGRFQFAKRVVGYALSPETVLQQLLEKHQAERQAQTAAARAQLAKRVAETKAARTADITKLTARHERARQALLTRQADEKTKMHDAWRQAPQPEHSKRATTAARSKEEAAQRERRSKIDAIRHPSPDARDRARQLIEKAREEMPTRRRERDRGRGRLRCGIQ